MNDKKNNSTSDTTKSKVLASKHVFEGDCPAKIVLHLEYGMDTEEHAYHKGLFWQDVEEMYLEQQQVAAQEVVVNELPGAGAGLYGSCTSTTADFSATGAFCPLRLTHSGDAYKLFKELRVVEDEQDHGTASSSLGASAHQRLLNYADREHVGTGTADGQQLACPASTPKNELLFVNG
ncbi:unnamed protein product, partial [Amoebophrya sp. A120]|eukprot:GSA120T00012021001.1